MKSPSRRVKSSFSFDLYCLHLRRISIMDSLPQSSEIRNTEAEEPPSDPNSKRKRNRWGEAPVSLPVTSNEPLNDHPTDKKNRKSRWTSSSAVPPVQAPLPGFHGVSAPNTTCALSVGASVDPSQQALLQQSMVLKLQLQKINEKMKTVVQDAAAIEQNPNRSPSPPPRYDSNGKRTNTREVRMMESLNKERLRILDELLKLNPQYQSQKPPDFLKGKAVRKIYMPKANRPIVQLHRYNHWAPGKYTKTDGTRKWL